MPRLIRNWETLINLVLVQTSVPKVRPGLVNLLAFSVLANAYTDYLIFRHGIRVTPINYFGSVVVTPTSNPFFNAYLAGFILFLPTIGYLATFKPRDGWPPKVSLTALVVINTISAIVGYTSFALLSPYPGHTLAITLTIIILVIIDAMLTMAVAEWSMPPDDP